MNFKQHVNEPTHNLGHTLDLVISYGLEINVFSCWPGSLRPPLYIFEKYFLLYTTNCYRASSKVVSRLTPEVSSN